MSLVSRLDVKPSPDLGAISPDEAREEWNWAWDRLMAHWIMWEGAGAPRDISGRGNHAALPGGTANPVWTRSTRGVALDFDGNNDYVSVADNNALDFDEALTVSFWLRPDTLAQPDTPVKKGESGNMEFQFIFPSPVKLRLRIDTNNGTATVDSNSILTTDERQHIVGIYDGAEIRIYVDSVEQNSSAQTGSIVNTTHNLHIGSGDQGSGGTENPQRFFNGIVDDVRIYNRVLTDTEIRLLYLYPFGPIQPVWMDSVNGLFIPEDAAAPVVTGLRQWQHERHYPCGVSRGILRGAIR